MTCLDNRQKGERILATKIRGLGKGLDAIFMENNFEIGKDGEISVVRISDVEPNKAQPRNTFDENALSELADSIASKGILQPLIVRPINGERYQIIAGERRWRASRMAGLTEVPVVVKDIDDSEAMEIALIENLQRKDLSPIEEAKGYKSLMDKYDLTQEEISKVVSKSRSSVANALRILNLPNEVLQLLEDEEITMGHAKALLSLKSASDIKALADKIVAEGLSVRQAEQLVQNMLNKKPPKKEFTKSRETIYDEIEISLKECLGRTVKVRENKNNRGTLQIEFFNEDDLMDLVSVFGR